MPILILLALGHNSSLQSESGSPASMHNEPADKFVAAFLKPPLYSTNYDKGFGTIYTSVYWPTRGIAEFHWPGAVWKHKLGMVKNSTRHIRYPDKPLVDNAKNFA